MGEFKEEIKSLEEIGQGAAKEIGIKPTSIDYIEAKGFLCHELLCLLGGRIEFFLTPLVECTQASL